MPQKRWRSTNKHELIIEVWEALDCESVGAVELEQIQLVIRDVFGEGAVDSPAAIARTVADEGAVLRHPEVLECDTKWRERELLALILPEDLNFSGFVEASESIRKLEALRRKFEQGDAQRKLHRLRELALKCKQESQATARSRVVEKKQRLHAQEISQWLTVWLQEPHLFEAWLSLRQRSPEFMQLLDEGDQ